MTTPPLYGLLVEFDSPARLTLAIRRTRGEGYAELEAFAPVPLEAACEELGRKGTWIPAFTLLGGVIGAAIGYAIQHFANVIDYPLNVGGRPPLSWPAFAVVTIEMGLLVAAIGAAIGMLALNGLPRPHHPVFNVPAFDLASQTRYFLCVCATDAKFDRVETHRLLTGLGGVAVWEVPLQVGDGPEAVGRSEADAEGQP